MTTIRVNQKGISLLEIVVVLGLLAVVMTVLGQLNIGYLKNISSGGLALRANVITAETLEALRALKEEDWNTLANLNLNTSYYLVFSTTTSRWSIHSSNVEGLIGGIFTRSFTARQVLRDSSGKIVSSGGANDSQTRLVEAHLNWFDHGTSKTVTLRTYLSKFR